MSRMRAEETAEDRGGVGWEAPLIAPASSAFRGFGSYPVGSNRSRGPQNDNTLSIVERFFYDFVEGSAGRNSTVPPNGPTARG